ncbi:alpha-1,2-fucosyltransferase [uncultured Mucilaginibacter sp.]|uniref:alpha-1,2-fucosyltransferase n=1 Tax=uncultured Mucilaginibacter sp. TaxID=797541 RepID=UPI0025EB0852|nr:alpha-1,2-fucosyltransferase [uncultured Mucilaginibacter sp.]
MIAVRLEGRLGNQLFQYAFIHSVSKKLKTRFFIDKSVINFMVPAYFELKQTHLSVLDKYIFTISGYKNIFNYHLKVACYKLLKGIYGLRELVFENELSPGEQLKGINDKLLYTGFFQSEAYFIDHKKEVVNLFSVKKSHREQFKNIFKTLPASKKYVTVHIRRGDYSGLDLVLSADYYKRAIHSIHTDENYYIFISDDFEFINREFGHIENKYLSGNTEIIDFQFLTHADICILSASSFSWWGAYLNPKHPKVIAPAYWLGKNEGKELPVNVIPEGWIKFN